MRFSIKIVLIYMLLICKCYASVLGVDPVYINMDFNEKVQSINITNYGREKVIVQIYAFNWTQHNGEDVYVQSESITSNPPVLTLLPHQSQVIRIGLLDKKLNRQQESSYRIFIREIPLYKQIKEQIKIISEFNLPLFVKPDVVNKNISWNISAELYNQTQKLILCMSNKGNIHAKINNIKLTRMNGEVLFQQDNFFYVLHDSYKRLSISLNDDLLKKIRNESVILYYTEDDYNSQKIILHLS